MNHHRILCPVGQGGFDVERIGDFTVAYDCGSVSSPNMVENCIDHLSKCVWDHLDILFISHFDNDHVNSIRYLLKTIRVKKVVTSLIPHDLRVAYDLFTNGGYSAIISIVRSFNGEILLEEVGWENENRRYVNATDSFIWEWIAKSMMEPGDFSKVREQLEQNGVDLHRLDDIKHLEDKRKEVNSAFKKVFGAKGPNTKGLIVLSQNRQGVLIKDATVYKGCARFIYCGAHTDDVAYNKSSCLYVGDADLKNKRFKTRVEDFINANLCEEKLLLMQIPHHGSRENIGVRFESDFPAHLFFVHDKDNVRLRKNKALYKSLTGKNVLLPVRGLCRDLVFVETEIE